ncbi:60 kda ss-a/ro ribonucleoprotein [Plakobranchus ocellatus]|uniref:60 kDa ss-a/ro ribonucleoprotein n=1 Tax=Plakobranchus ocellatus TaxID=259542 RepID=A0AAV3ZS23_9GAST|nr:60 kda ss-a/ro ribonucleoprotein [Plakobranchus ocellatus]
MPNSLPETLPPFVVNPSVERRQPHTMTYRRLEAADRDRLFNSDTAQVQPDDDEQRSQINFSARLPDWLWAVLAAMLGIGGKRRKWRLAIATSLHVLTLVFGFMFAFCGFVFNVFDVMSERSETTMLVGICKCVLGAYWVGLGIYSHSLAARLFSNVRLVECIRLHSKTLFKVNTAFIILVLSVAVVIVNIYWNRTLIHNKHDPILFNETKVQEGNCATAGINVFVCEMYYVARIVYSIAYLMWNLLVSSILLSVCRTHTIWIRRFVKELLYDFKIYEEFLMLQALGPRVTLVEGSNKPQDKRKRMPTVRESDIWDDDIEDTDYTERASQPPENVHILKSMRRRRYSTFDTNSLNIPRVRSAQAIASSQEMDYIKAPAPKGSKPADDNLPNRNPDNGDEPVPPTTYAAATSKTKSAKLFPRSNSVNEFRSSTGVAKESASLGEAGHVTIQSVDGRTSQARLEESMQQTGDFVSAIGSTEALYKNALEDKKPPILSNEDLLYTYFLLVRRYSSTSRILQRWVATTITFVMVWSTLLIIYWTTHDTDYISFFEFFVPLFILYLLTSAYADANSEASSIIKCVLPTQERVPVLFYMRNIPIELKVFSVTLTYNAILTVVAGVAVTIASRIILEQFGLG